MSFCTDILTCLELVACLLSYCTAELANFVFGLKIPPQHNFDQNLFLYFASGRCELNRGGWVSKSCRPARVTTLPYQIVLLVFVPLGSCM